MENIAPNRMALPRHLGLLHLIVGQQTKQGFQPRSGAAVLIAVQQGKAQKDAARMIKAAKVGAGDIVKTGLGAVIGMRAPSGVMQQAGGLDQAQAFFVGAIETAAPER